MAATTLLHIQTADSATARVLELSGNSIRIGRGSQCEVRLSEPRLAEVQCMLRRRGEVWYLQPVGPAGLVLLFGKPVQEARPLPPGVPVCVGSHWLTLKLADEATGRIGSFHSPIVLDVHVESEAEPERREPLPAPIPPTPEAVAVTSTKRLATVSLSAAAEQTIPLGSFSAERSRPGDYASAARRAKPATWSSKPPSGSAAPGPSVARPPSATVVAALLSARETRPAPTSNAMTAPSGSVARAGWSDRPSAAPPEPAMVESLEIARENPPLIAPPLAAASPDPSPEPRPEPASAVVLPNEPGLEQDTAREQRARWEAYLQKRDRWLKARKEERRWEARWRAAGARLRARTAQAPPRPPLPPSTPPQPPRVPGSPKPQRSSAPSADALLNRCSAEEVLKPPIVPLPLLGRVIEPEPSPAPTPPPPAPSPAPKPSHFEPWVGRERELQPTAEQPQATALSDNPAPAVPPPRAEGRPRRDPLHAAPGKPPTRLGLSRSGEEPSPFPLPEAEPWRGVQDPLPGEGPEPAASARPETLSRPTTPGLGEATDPFSLSPHVRSAATGQEWPSAKVILQARRVAMEAAARRKETIRSTTAPRPVPTLGQAPSAWAIPVGLVGLPIAAILLMVGLAGVGLGWIWSQDAWEAGQLSDRLLRAEGPASAEEFEAFGLTNEPNAAWWASTASHLFLWALMAHRLGPDAEHGEQVRTFLDAARQAAPLQPSVRFAQAHAIPGDGPSTRSAADILGLSRDVIALAWVGHALLEEGQTDAGLDAYRAALEMAARADPARAAPPTFLDDPQIRRYTLPHEDLVGRIVREMADRPEWTFAQWSAALPRFGVAPVAAYHVLRERGSPDAEKALDLLLSNVDTPPPSDVAPAVLLAAVAEALALRGQWSEAEQRYQSAIAQMPSDRIRRSWWMNLADIYLRLNDDAQKRAAWEAAKGPDPDEEITQRAIQALRQDGGAGKDADRSPRGFSPIEKP